MDGKQSRRAAISSLLAAPLAPGLLKGAEALDAFSQNRRIGRGVNILGYDPVWHTPAKARFTVRHFERIKAAGFQSVRINLAPFRAMDASRNYRLSDAWLKTLDWAVSGALANGLAVVLDCHEFQAMGEDPAGNRERFLAFWNQAGLLFRYASPQVMFELLNEPSRNLTPQLWNSYLAEALAIVRASNPARTVILGPAGFNKADSLESLRLPERDRNIIVTLHYYLPMAFTHQGAPWNEENKDKTGVEWVGTPEEQQIIVQDFTKARMWARAQNRPVFLGEFGAYDKAPMESRARYTAFVARTAEKMGWSWAYWQFDSDFLLYNVEEDRWVEPIRDALIPKS